MLCHTSSLGPTVSETRLQGETPSEQKKRAQQMTVHLTLVWQMLQLSADTTTARVTARYAEHF